MEKITILGKSYDIAYLDDNFMQGLLGSAKRSVQKINIAEGMAEDQKAETLLHEVLHIISGELALDLSEETITRLAVGVYSSGYRLKK